MYEYPHPMLIPDCRIADYEYNGQSGLDFDANLQIATIDFGTFHLYPQVSYQYHLSATENRS